jgi:hypothetical protein
MSEPQECVLCGHLVGNHVKGGCGVPDCGCTQPQEKLGSSMQEWPQEWRELANALRVHAKELISPEGTNASTLKNNLVRAADLLAAHNATLAKAHQDGWYEGRNYEIKLRAEQEGK